MVATLAFSSAFFYGLSNVLTQVGLRGSNTLSGLLISQLSTLAASLFIFLFVIPIDQFANRAVLYFVAAGVMGPFIARFLLYVGINRVGSSIASPLYETKPLFSTIAAVVILGERLTTSIALGMFLIITGAAAISSEKSGGQIEKKWSRKDLIFPVMAGAGFGVAHVLRKMGLNVAPEPIAGVTIQNAAALAFFPLLALAQRNQQRVSLNNKRAWFIFSLAGLSSVIGQLCLFYALNLGRVVIVSPLSSISPFFVLLLVGIFLKKIERITLKIVLGTVLIVGGAAALTLVPPG
ncbi:MAG: DMT family transporter [Dehalococcoidia bacterium]|nr:MAG: DMT family transporter [Dehalococcoidia bacterium]